MAENNIVKFPNRVNDTWNDINCKLPSSVQILNILTKEVEFLLLEEHALAFLLGEPVLRRRIHCGRIAAPVESQAMPNGVGLSKQNNRRQCDRTL